MEQTLSKEELDELFKECSMCWKDDNANKVWMGSPETFRKQILDNMTIAGKPLSEEDKDEIIEYMGARKNDGVQRL